MTLLKNLLSSRLVKIGAIVAVFGLIGIGLIVQSHAATFVVAIEAESGQRTGNTTAGLVTGASNSQAVQFSMAATPPSTPPPVTPPTTPPTPTTPPATPPASNSLYITPQSGTYTVGSTVTLAIRTNIGTASPINAAQADFTYSSNLEFVSWDLAGSDYGFGCPQKNAASGKGTIACIPELPTTGQPSLSGDKLMAKANFKVLAKGTGSVQFDATSQALSVASSTNVLGVLQGVNLTLQ